MIKSILDSDLYKFSTSYAYMKSYPEAEGTFVFNDRDKTEYTADFLQDLSIEFSEIHNHCLTKDEYDYVTNKIKYIPRFYWDWLRTFHFDSSKINFYLDSENHLHIEVTDLLYKCTLYEVPILAIVSELRNKMLGYRALTTDVIEKLDKKITLANCNNIKFSEFGTRRRFSYNVQDEVIKEIKKKSITCVGTSNVHFAMKYNMTPIGTHPHEWAMFHGAMYGYRMANYFMMEQWSNVYYGELGVALTDTYTSKVFFKNFTKKHAHLFTGIRQDSGDEYEFTNNAIARYKELGIDPMTKTVVFSNALDFEKALKIKQFCEGRINSSFGIGTNLTNDCGVKPSNIVMKLMMCRMNSNQDWVDCLKVSDDVGKVQGSSKEMDIFNLTFSA